MVLVLSILCFLGLQHHASVPNGNLHPIATRNVVTNSGGSASQFAAQLANKVAVPFGDVSFNISSSLPQIQAADSDLVRRAKPKGPTLKLDVAICKGKALRRRIANALTAGHDARTWTPGELEENGWIDLTGVSDYEIPEVVESALREVGTDPTVGMENRYILMGNQFTNSQGVKVSLWCCLSKRPTNVDGRKLYMKALTRTSSTRKVVPSLQITIIAQPILYRMNMILLFRQRSWLWSFL